jgi:hypothetical protein
MENVVPSTWNTRWPRQRWPDSRVCGSAASTTRVSSDWYTASGSRERAWQ